MQGLGGFGLRIVERVPSHVEPNPENINYLQTKETRMGHMLELKDKLAGVDFELGADEATGAAPPAAEASQ